MRNKLKGELIKEKYNSKLHLIMLIGVLSILGLYLWQGFFASQQDIEIGLQNVRCANSYGLMLFGSLEHRIAGILIGFAIINIEISERCYDYSLVNNGKIEFMLCKAVSGAMCTFFMVILSRVLPVISCLILSNDAGKIGILDIFNSGVFFIWLATYGFAIIGIVLGVLIRNFAPIIAVVMLLEFANGMFPQFLSDIWEKIDGYWYFSNLLNSEIAELRNLKYFAISNSNQFTGIEGLLIWILLMIVFICLSFKLIER